MKYLLVLVVVVVVLWLMLRGRASSVSSSRRRRGRAEAQTMVACAHCGVHLPRPEAVTDAAGRPYCSEAHRLAGPH